MRLHSSAQWLQASAHSWQWSCSCFSHSTAQASQTSAQTRQSSAAKDEPRLMKAAAVDKSFEAFQTEFFQKVRPTSLIKRFASPAEVATLVAYVASPLASATTGAALRVDGGVIKSAF